MMDKPYGYNTLACFFLFLKKNKKNSENFFNFIFFKKNFSIKIFLFIFLCTGIISCKKNEEKELETFSRDQLTIEKGKDVEIIYSDSARIKSRVTGPEMLRYTDIFDPRQEFTKGVKTYFYDDQQKEIGILTGKYAIRNERKRQVIVRDSVVWESKTDGRLETEELIWNEATNTIKSSKFTTITRQNEKIFGFNFETDDKLSHWRILNPKGNIKVDAIDKATQ